MHRQRRRPDHHLRQLTRQCRPLNRQVGEWVWFDPPSHLIGMTPPALRPAPVSHQSPHSPCHLAPAPLLRSVLSNTTSFYRVVLTSTSEAPNVRVFMNYTVRAPPGTNRVCLHCRHPAPFFYAYARASSPASSPFLPPRSFLPLLIAPLPFPHTFLRTQLIGAPGLPTSTRRPGSWPTSSGCPLLSLPRLSSLWCVLSRPAPLLLPCRSSAYCPRRDVAGRCLMLCHVRVLIFPRSHSHTISDVPFASQGTADLNAATIEMNRYDADDRVALPLTATSNVSTTVDSSLRKTFVYVIVPTRRDSVAR